VDIYAKSEIYQLVHRLAEQGVAVVVISSELPEVIGICDRVLVMREGAITGELAGADITQEAIMRLATDTAGMHGTHAGGSCRRHCGGPFFSFFPFLLVMADSTSLSKHDAPHVPLPRRRNGCCTGWACCRSWWCCTCCSMR
jgi:ribose transport system ATP-binding protein